MQQRCAIKFKFEHCYYVLVISAQRSVHLILLLRLFGLSACRRMTAREAQGHQWLNHKRSRTTLHFQPLTQDVTERLKSYKDQSVLKV
jgi:hypothetical protein